MASASFSGFTDGWSRAAYEVRVRGTSYVWGSAGITRNASFAQAPILHLRNDTFGEEVTIAVRHADGTELPYGSLQAGECLSIGIEGITGVLANCAADSTISCLIGR